MRIIGKNLQGTNSVAYFVTESMTKKKDLNLCHSVKIIKGLFQKLLVDSLWNFDLIKSIFLASFASQGFSIWILSFFLQFHLAVMTLNIMTLCIVALSVAILKTKVQQSWMWNTLLRVIWMIVIQLNVTAPLKLFSDFDFYQKCFIWLVFSLQSHFIAGLIISKLLDGTRAPPISFIGPALTWEWVW